MYTQLITTRTSNYDVTNKGQIRLRWNFDQQNLSQNLL